MSENQGLSSLVPRGPETRAWKVEVNGVPVEEEVKSLRIICQRRPGDETDVPFQVLEYGAEHDAGVTSKFDTIVLISQGGALTLLYAILKSHLFVGLVDQKRFCERHSEFNPSGKVWNASRGFRGKSNDARDTARHELRGEVGDVVGEVVHLDGPAVNADNAWFTYLDTERDGNPEQGGVSMFAAEINPEHLLVSNDSYVFNPDNLGARPKGSDYEVIGNCVFMPWHQAVLVREGLTIAAIARLLRKLELSGRLSMNLRQSVVRLFNRFSL